jgi:hypothetical protein
MGDNEPKSQSEKETEQKEPNNNKVVRTQPKKQIVPTILPDLPASEPDRSTIFDIAAHSNAVASPSKSVLIATSNIVSTTNKIRE